MTGRDGFLYICLSLRLHPLLDVMGTALLPPIMYSPAESCTTITSQLGQAYLGMVKGITFEYILLAHFH